MNIVSFSTGLSSALTVERVVARHGADNTRIVFMDTRIEDDDNYRFMRDCSVRWENKYGVRIEILAEGRTPYEVFVDEHVIPNNRVAPCTRRLKINLFVAYMKEHFGENNPDITIHIGYDYSELHRVEATRRNYNNLGWNVDFPLMWKPIETRDYATVVKQDWGIDAPRMYSMGYSHANCGGRCVKQGKNDWLRTLKMFPERYAEIEQWEQDMRLNPVNSKYTIVARVKHGVKIPITLKQLREEYESRTEISLLDLENETCVVCGVGDISEGLIT